MKKARFDTGRFVQGLILFGFSIYLIKLFQTNEINKLVAQNIATLLKITLAVLIIMTFYALGTIYSRSRDCDCDHEDHHHHDHDHGHSHRPKPRLGWLLLVFPVMLGVIVPTQSLNATMMSKGLLASAKGNAQMTFGQKSTPQVTVEKVADVAPKEAAAPPASSPKPQGQAQADPAVPYVDLSTIQKVEIPDDQRPPKPKPGSEISVVELFSNILIAPEYYFNQRYTFTGFVYHPPGWPTDRLIVTRYLITCCAADATPVGLVVQANDAAKYPDNTWVKIDGTVSSGQIQGAQSIPPISWYYGLQQSPILYPKTMQTIPEPADPYEMPKTPNNSGSGGL